MGKYAQLLEVQDADPQNEGKYSRELLESTPNASPRPSQKPAPTWIERTVDAIRGRQDPSRADVQTITEQEPMFGAVNQRQQQAATFGASDAQLHDAIKDSLGARYIGTETDANGYPIIRYRGEDGAERQGYVNRPGLDTEDIVRGVRGSLPYLITGGATGVAARGAGLGVNALAQGAAAGATSVGGDIAQIPMGSEQGIELPKAAGTAALGVVAPIAGAAVGALWRRFVTVPGLFDSAAGKLTPKGVEAAQKAGVDPAQMEAAVAENFAKAYAKTGNAMASAVQAQSQGGIPVTRGQMTKRPDLLMQEEAMRRNLYGDQARQTMEGFDAAQRAAIRAEALGPDLPPQMPTSVQQRLPKTGVGSQLAPHRRPGTNADDIRPDILGDSVRTGVIESREGARLAENQAWEGVRDLSATPDALDMLPQFINSRLGDVVVDDAVTPTASRMGRELDAFIQGEVPASNAGIIKAQKIQSVDQMRRRLGKIAGAAAPGEDKRAAGAVYDAFNDWIAEAAEKQLLAGNADAAMQIVKARGFTREVRDLFAPRTAEGTRSPAALRISKVLDPDKADSGEAVITALFGAGTSSTAGSQGTVQALTNIKTALERFAPKAGKQAWDDIRLAYWARLNLDKTGKMAGPAAIQSNIENALRNNRSILQVLYTPDEMRAIGQYLSQIRNVAYKPPNASGSGYVGASLIKEMTTNLLNSFGLGRITSTALQMSGLPKAYGASLARSAINPKQASRPSAISPVITGTAAADQRQR